jgi:hypothetical protein
MPAEKVVDFGPIGENSESDWRRPGRFNRHSRPARSIQEPATALTQEIDAP